MQIPSTMRSALEREAARFKLAELDRAQERLSEGYRAGKPLQRLTDAERVAYAVARMPATYAACLAVLMEVARQVAAADSRAPLRSLLDLGAGSGAMLWAAAEAMPGLGDPTLVEADAGMIQLGRALAGDDAASAVSRAKWVQADIADTRLSPHDVVTCSYSLGELPEARAEMALQAAWRVAGQLLVIIEPGTPAGFARVRCWREQLLGAGAYMAAPCPHARACPLPENDWCHFAQRVERTSLHRRLKGGSLGHEDEKYSYLAVSKLPVPLPAARIIRHPQVAPGAIKLELCAAAGLQEVVVRKKDREQFRRARKAEWGDAWETDLAS